MHTPNLSDADLPERVALDHQLSFALYGAANRMVRLHKPILDPLGLTFPQYLVLLELFAGTPKTVGDLGAKLGIDAGTITPLLKRLEAAGRITRTRDASDERRVLIELTKAGEALRHPIWAVTRQIDTVCGRTNEDNASLRNELDGFARA